MTKIQPNPLGDAFSRAVNKHMYCVGRGRSWCEAAKSIEGIEPASLALVAVSALGFGYLGINPWVAEAIDEVLEARIDQFIHDLAEGINRKIEMRAQDDCVQDIPADSALNGIKG